jgi:DNA-binding NtrC family response regulator
MVGPQVLLQHEDNRVRVMWRQRLAAAGFTVAEASSLREDVARILVKEDPPEILVCGELSGSADASFEVIRQVRERRPPMAIIFVATQSSEALAIRALRAGVTDYIRQPLQVEELVASVTRILGRIRTSSESYLNSKRLDDESSPLEKILGRPFIGDSPIMREVKSHLLRVAVTDSNVLITGETGTGKELAAQLIHHASSRKSKPLVSVNCAAIPETLLESELFGYERGAFTGAQWANAGLLERADGGTLFLDEVGEMSPVAQAKVLRIIETKELSRLGGRETIRVNVRFVSATNQNIETLMNERRFRPDLYYRLNVLRVKLPPLRERKQDLPVLISYYVQELNRQFGRQVEGFSNASYQRLLAYDWPGNIRELRNLLEAAFVNASPGNATHIDLPAECGVVEDCAGGTEERDRVLSALLSTKWNKSAAAKQLRWSRMTLYRKMTRYQLLDARPRQGTDAA